MHRVLETFASRFAPGTPRPGNAVSIPSLTGASDAFLALALSGAGTAKPPRICVAVTPGLPDADRLSQDIRVVSAALPASDGLIRVLEMPPILEGDRQSVGVRLKTIAALRAWDTRPYPAVVVVSFPALATPIPRRPPSPIRLGTADAGGGASEQCKTCFGELCRRLAAAGYRRVPTVESEGDYSVRGGIVDAWSPGDEFPVRAEFFGETLESLRSFNPATQISVGRIDFAELLPADDGMEDAEGNGRFATILDMVPDGSAVLAIEHNSYSLAGVAGQGEALRRFAVVYTGDPAPRGVPGFAFQTSPLPGFAELGPGEAHHPELFDAARARLAQHVEAAKAKGSLVAKIDDLSGGFEIGPQGSGGLVVETKSDRVFAKRRASVRPSRTENAGARLSDFEELDPGEYVVHVDYGVGRFVGSSEIQVDGKRSEVFTIEYADGAKLHVPADHAHLISRYVGVKGETVRLHRLDGKRWNRDKAEAQKAITDLAASLLRTQASRETTPGYSYDVNCDGMQAFEAAFPYEETPDQLAAIEAVKRDLSSTKPMDRLICGDAGYGKTEVAMRAAYIAAMNGRQVAVLAPTTVLAEQHFETFTSRFDGTPVRIESVSRFQSHGTHDATFKRLENGVCDIVIGTHAILSSKIRFHDLGLIIIDEEQRFGVRHKEFLKSLRATADVLTMSATPIPRTLYLSMTGARDLSLLRTAPRERTAVELHIVRDSDDVVASAIEAELARGGQAYFLHNRVMSIGRVAKRLEKLVPNARIVVAHGQMDAVSLARKMRDFEQGKYDVLLSTTIIESGIDIPRANTIIIDEADHFGLADLYQLRGRVGRSAAQGRAYLLLPASGSVDSEARERLAALQKHGGLGAGFGLAVRDLEIRGAGNLLGSQQSGHIATIGFTLYCQLLQRTIAMMRGEKPKEIVDVRLNIDFIDLSPSDPESADAAALPYGYVEEDVQRMSFMKRLAEASDAKAVKAIADELADRFGELPPAAERLILLSKLRVECAKAGIGHVDVKDGRAVFYRTGEIRPCCVENLKGKTADARIRSLLALARRSR